MRAGARGKAEATRAGATSGEATWAGAEATVRLGQLVLRLRRRPRLHGAEVATGGNRFVLNFISIRGQIVKLSNCVCQYCQNVNHHKSPPKVLKFSTSFKDPQIHVETLVLRVYLTKKKVRNS